MSDFLLELSKNPQARNVVQTLGLPIPMPQDLRRSKGPSVERPLDDRDVAFHGSASSALTGAPPRLLTRAAAAKLRAAQGGVAATAGCVARAGAPAATPRRRGSPRTPSERSSPSRAARATARE